MDLGNSIKQALQYQKEEPLSPRMYHNEHESLNDGTKNAMDTAGNGKRLSFQFGTRPPQQKRLKLSFGNHSTVTLSDTFGMPDGMTEQEMADIETQKMKKRDTHKSFEKRRRDR